MFVALKGETFNGNAFAAKALEAGCAFAVIDEACYAQPNDERYFLVEDCLKALQQLANLHRRTLGTRIIGITGTNGKTTTKELMAAVLSKQFNILYTQGNLNNQIGVPLTLLKLRPEHQLAVIEMGASHPGDIQELVEIAEPDCGLITNVGKAHLQGFGSFEGVIRTKGELYDFLRTRPDAFIFLHDDNPYLKDIAHGLKAIHYGSQADLFVSGKSTANSPFLAFELQADGKTHSVQTQLIGDYNLPNALAAVTVGRYFGVPDELICEALSQYAPQNNRSQLKQTDRNTLIIDAYNANPSSMQVSIDNFHRMQATDKLLILGDMRELGEDGAAEHQKVVDQLIALAFTNVYLVGELFGATQHPFRSFTDAPSLIEALQAEQPSGKTILIKGSNGIRLFSIVEYL
jgi:UDP-N-acetylmuramoyl-tripeptide--D-alanyl-D-alanine ligase